MDRIRGGADARRQPGRAARAPHAHAAVMYRGEAGLREAVVPFLREGVDRGDAVLAALPRDHIASIRGALGPAADRVGFADMTQLGANPARIIPAIRTFVEARPGGRVRFVGEPIWSARCPCELREATRHESLLNLAFAGEPVSILCPYDEAALPPEVIADAERTHPVVIRGGSAGPSPRYLGEAALPPSCDGALAAPPAGAEWLGFDGASDIAPLRRHAGASARAAGVGADRATDLELALSEVLSNTLRHSGGGGTLSIWSRPGRVLCQVEDAGRVDDPLAGRRAPAAGTVGGWGLLVANKLCDLVEVRTGATGTTVRLHMATAA